MSTVPGGAWLRADIAEAYVSDRRALIPLIDGQDELIRRLITRGERRVDRFLDLGAGAGAFAELVMQTNPGATGVLVDFSEPMVAAASRRLAPYAGRWQYLLADLSQSAWCEEVPAGFDAVVSAFCIHHLPDERKREVFREAYELLEPGGLFMNWEHVAASGIGDGMLEEWMIDRILAVEQTRPDPRPEQEVVKEFLDAADGDILADAHVQCEWLRDVGFQAVEVFFEMPEIAIFGGVKPTEGG
jgi:SAM-dependent methyltransferase